MINLVKTKAMIFHTPKLTCKQVTITLFRGQVKYWIYVYVCMHVPPSIPHMDHVYIGSVHMCMYTDSYMYAGASIHPTYEIRI